MSRPRIVFAGTPDFSVPCLQALLDSPVDIVGVYTQPDRAAGRGKKLQPGPVKRRALEAGLQVFQPRSFKAAADRETLAALKPDLMIVVAYGLILPQSVLDIPRLGCVNVHASLLPRWRGAAPIQRAIEAGDQQTGVCLMQMDKGLDSGPVLATRRIDIHGSTTGGQLHDALSSLGAELLQDSLQDVLDGQIEEQAQSDQGVCYAHKLEKKDSRIDWSMNATDIANKIRAFNPWPVMSGTLNGQVLRIHQAQAGTCSSPASGIPGEILEVSAAGMCVSTADGQLNISHIQKPGGKVLEMRDFLNGFKVIPGQHFE